MTASLAARPRPRRRFIASQPRSATRRRGATAASGSGGAEMSALPGVRRKAAIRPHPSVRAWIFGVEPPRERPMACAPFSAMGRTMRPHGGRRCRARPWRPGVRPAPAPAVEDRGRGAPQAAGRSFQRQPDFRTCTMPEIPRRSSTRRAPGWLTGRSGLIAAQGLVRKPAFAAHPIAHPRPAKHGTRQGKQHQ